MKKLTRELVAEIVQLHYGARRLSSYAIAADFKERHGIVIDRTTVLHHLKNSPEGVHERGRISAALSPSVVIDGQKCRQGKSYQEITEANEWRRQEEMAKCQHRAEAVVIRRCTCCGKVETTREPWHPPTQKIV